MQVLRGHSDEIFAVAFSDQAQLMASGSKDGDLMLWKADGKSATDGYFQIPGHLRVDEVMPLNASRLLLLPPDEPPQLMDLKRTLRLGSDSLPEIGASADVLGFFGTNTLCHWDGIDHQMVLQEWLDERFVRRGALSLDSRRRPTGLACHPGRQLVAWAESSSSNSVFLASLATPGRRVELKADVPGLLPLFFSLDGEYLAAVTKGQEALHGWGALRLWKIEAGDVVASVDGLVRDAKLAVGGQRLVVCIKVGNDHEVRFYDLGRPDQPPRSVSGKGDGISLAVSPNGLLVALCSNRGEVQLFDPLQGERIESLRRHLQAVFGLAFSPDGRRLISTSGGREAIKLWDVGTRQEVLTLPGAGSLLLAAAWSADGNAILTAEPWQAWSAPSWDEIAAAERSSNGR